MKRRLLLITLLITLTTLVLAGLAPDRQPVAYSQVNPTPAPTPTTIPIPAVLAAIDQELSGLWPLVVAKQAQYYGNHGRFFQGLYTHSVTPTDGNQAVPDRLWAKPTDQGENWMALNIERLGPLQHLPFALWMDSYQAPGGDGFVACVEVVIQGRLGRRCQNYGPESQRTHDWIEVLDQ